MKATETSVLDLIGGNNKSFVIPPFQRNYEWNYSECDELFSDIVHSYKTNKNHYLGNIIYYPGENDGASFHEYILIDGQQRITSILLLLCAIRNIFKNKNLEDKATDIDEMYLKNKRNSEYRIRLKQTSYDELAFNALINNLEIIEDYKESNIIKNYYYFLDLIKESETDVNSLFETIIKLEIVAVNLQQNNLEDVQTVFEKINSTGKPLSPADLIRNFLLLSSSSKEQESLYKNYWTSLEQTLKNENISKFAKDFIILNTYEEIPNDSIYKKFKEYVDSNKISHKDILKDMNKYATYFSWIKFETCPNKTLNKSIQYLNLLKNDDFYSLYLLLFDKLFNSNPNELEKIMNLLTDFMIRYRIVSPSNGGSSLKQLIYNLLKSLSKNDKNISYDFIYFELSNSPSSQNRFPDNKDFKEQLMNSVNTTYARVLLLKIEESETKNIPVPLNKVTIEHLMPQKLNSWWKDYLGDYETIYDKYINCIGNLAPISRPYNSKNSNNPWTDKLPLLQKVQFSITSEIATNSDYLEWKEDNIKIRNEDIANRACEKITTPLERTRPYETKNNLTEFEPGIYPVTDLDTPMEYTSPSAIIFEDKEYRTSTWNSVLPTVCEILKDIDFQLLNKIIDENTIHKSTSTKVDSGKNPIITRNKEDLVSPMKIENTDFYVEGSLSSYRVRVYLKQLLDEFSLTDFVQLSVDRD